LNLRIYSSHIIVSWTLKQSEQNSTLLTQIKYLQNLYQNGLIDAQELRDSVPSLMEDDVESISYLDHHVYGGG